MSHQHGAFANLNGVEAKSFLYLFTVLQLWSRHFLRGFNKVRADGLSLCLHLRTVGICAATMADERVKQHFRDSDLLLSAVSTLQFCSTSVAMCQQLALTCRYGFRLSFHEA